MKFQKQSILALFSATLAFGLAGCEQQGGDKTGGKSEKCASCRWHHGGASDDSRSREKIKKATKKEKK